MLNVSLCNFSNVYMKINLFPRIFAGMCFALCLAACEKNNYYTTVVGEAEDEEVPMRNLDVEALSQSWLGTRGDGYISPLFAYLAPSISKYYEMGDPFEDMKLIFDNPAVAQEISVTMKASALNEERTVTMLTTRDDRIEMFFPIKWKYEVFSSIKSAMPITMEWEIGVKGNTICRYSKQFRVAPFQEDPYSVYWRKNIPNNKDYIAFLRTLDWGEYPIREDDERFFCFFSPFFFGYVSPNNPMVSKLKQEAIKDISEIKDGFFGYQWGNDYVKEQLAAFFWLMNKYGVVYSSEDTHLSTFAEVFNNGQGHCSTLTCAMASLCLSIGLNIQLVIIPEHMYLLVLDQAGNPLYPMDCTGIWNIDKTLPFEKQLEMSRECFECMLEGSAAEYEENRPFIEAGKAEYIVYPITSMEYSKSGIPSIDMPYISNNTRAVDEDIRVTCRKAVEHPGTSVSAIKKSYSE